MDWNPLNWLRRNGDKKDGRKDSSLGTSSYEDEVQDRCDHDWERRPVENATSFLGTPSDIRRDWNRFYAPKFRKGFAIFSVFTDQAKFCIECGKKKDGSTAALRDGKVAIPVAYRLDEGTRLEDALVEPTKPEADYAVDEDGETTVIGGEDEGRILVNKSLQQADDSPVAAGGATD